MADVLGIGATIGGLLGELAERALLYSPLYLGNDRASLERQGEPDVAVGRPEYLAQQSLAGRLTETEALECARLFALGVLIQCTISNGDGYKRLYYQVYRGP
ncbi:MAG: hypothetical protein Q7S26_04280 [bacterium]|nr:hypothetical protein [bacterium]